MNAMHYDFGNGGKTMNYQEERQEILAKANPIIKELLERKSVRVFTEREISNEEKRQILFAAAEAPTAGCQ